jgi:uncharacterized protein with PhoU and TrkA domain
MSKNQTEKKVSEIIPSSGTILHRVFRSYLQDMIGHIRNYENGLCDQDILFKEFDKTLQKLRLSTEYGVVKKVIRRAESILLQAVQNDAKLHNEDILSGEDDFEHDNMDLDQSKHNDDAYVEKITQNLQREKTELVEV